MTLDIQKCARTPRRIKKKSTDKSKITRKLEAKCVIGCYFLRFRFFDNLVIFFIRILPYNILYTYRIKFFSKRIQYIEKYLEYAREILQTDVRE